MASLLTASLVPPHFLTANPHLPTRKSPSTSPLTLCKPTNIKVSAQNAETHAPSSFDLPVVKPVASSSENSSSSSGRWMREGSKALAALAAALVLASGTPVLADEGPGFDKYFGTAASASSYGGYGGNASKRDTAEYIYEVPQGWKERLISKIEKGTNGTDSEFYNPRRKGEKVYLTFLAGFRKLTSRDNVLNNLALSDVSLQDMLASADNIEAKDRTNSTGQLYYDFEIDSPVAHGLISVTCTKNKLYAHFVKAPAQDWAKDESLLRHIHESFQTVGDAPLETV